MTTSGVNASLILFVKKAALFVKTAALAASVSRGLVAGVVISTFPEVSVA